MTEVAGNLARMKEGRNAFKILIGNPYKRGRERVLGRPSHR